MASTSVCRTEGLGSKPSSTAINRKEYLRKFQREWIAERRKEWFEKNGPCAKCGSWNDLELDHIDPALKISHSIWSWSENRRNAELAKCQALCHDCHLAKTAKQRMPEHGTRGRYRWHKCRCDECKKANSVYSKEWKRNKKTHSLELPSSSGPGHLAFTQKIAGSNPAGSTNLKREI